jgi:hypothetical protein
MPCAGQAIGWSQLHVVPRFNDETHAGKGMRWWIKQPDNTRASVIDEGRFA